MIGLSLIKENLVRSDSGLWFEDLNLTEVSDPFIKDELDPKITVKMLVTNTKNTLIEHLITNTNNSSTGFLDDDFKETTNETEEKKKRTIKSRQPVDHLTGFDFENNFGKKSFGEELLDDSLQEKYNLTHLPLYNKLLEYRSTEAKRQKIAPYRIFNNQTLEEIVKKKPTNEKELKMINGIGDAKIKEFGKDIIKLVSMFP